MAIGAILFEPKTCERETLGHVCVGLKLPKTTVRALKHVHRQFNTSAEGRQEFSKMNTNTYDSILLDCIAPSIQYNKTSSNVGARTLKAQEHRKQENAPITLYNNGEPQKVASCRKCAKDSPL